MATQVFAEEELERLRGFPEIGREELFRFFTLAPSDVAFVDPGRGRGPADRLGLSVALCTLPWLGFVPDDVAAAPPVAVVRLAEQLGVDPGVLRHYGRRAKTRTEHLRLVAQCRGWRVPTSLEFKEFDEFLLARAMEHDSPTLLFRLACEYLISVHVIRPGPVTVLERVAHARAQAQRETYDRLAHQFTEDRRTGLDGLLVVDPAIGMTRLRWLITGPVEASPAGIKAEVTKLEYLRGLGAARYLSDPAYRRKISRQLNKGESLHALKRDLLYAHEGTVRVRHLEAQTEQAWCLTLVTNAVVAWTTEYYGLAVESMRSSGRRVDDEVLAHISPAHSENINFFGAIDVDIEGELAQLGPTGYRPLRVRDTLF